MNILFATDIYLPTPGGISVVTNRLAHILAKRGHKVCIIAPATSWKFTREKEDDVEVFRIPAFLIHKLKQIRISPAGFYKKRIKKIISTFQPDIIHLETPSTIAITVGEIAKKELIPVIATCHIMPENFYGYLPFLPKQLEKSVGNIYVKQMAQVFNSYADFVTAPTETGISILKANGIKIPHQALSNGIDLSVFVRSSKTVQEMVKKKYGLPDTPLILYVGRLDKEKSVDMLLKAVPYIRKDIPFHVVIAGKGENVKILSQLAESLQVTSKVTFTGFVSDEELAGLYALASVFVMPSTAELQSLVTMEAMAVGVPVIGADAGALPYLIHNGENGYLFHPGDFKELAQKIGNILTNPKKSQEMVRKGKEFIQVHNITKVMPQLEQLYLSVIEQAAGAPRMQASHNFFQNVSSFFAMKNSS